jgi:hypothetical protein
MVKFSTTSDKNPSFSTPEASSSQVLPSQLFDG